MKTDKPAPIMDRVHDWTFARKFDGHPCNEAARRVAAQYRIKLRSAQKFVITDEAVRLCCNLSYEADQLDTWAILARLPYDVLWVEYDQHAKISEFDRMGVLQGPYDPETMLPRIGLLMYRDRMDTPCWISHQFYGEDDVYPAMVALLYDPEAEAHNPLRGSLTWRQPTLSLLPGFPVIPYTSKGHGHYWPRSHIPPEALVTGAFEQDEEGHTTTTFWSSDSTAVIVDPWWNAHLDMPREAKLKLIATALMQASGSLRWLVTFLAILNALPREIHEVIPRRGKRTVGANVLPYFQHRTVTLQIPKHDQIVWARGHMTSSARDGRNAPRPWHQVRGHWRVAEYKKRSGIHCNHEPELVENGLAICTKCELLVRWVESFHRGSAEVGMIEHDYRVTAKTKRKPAPSP